MWHAGRPGPGLAVARGSPQRGRAVTSPEAPGIVAAASDPPTEARRVADGGRFAWSIAREERFFLVLAIFIGLFSGLAVVCFRLAIEWSKIGLLGPMLE